MAAATQSQPMLTALPPASGRAGFRGTLASEFTKIRSVRSTYWTLLVLLVVSVGIGAAISAGTAASWSHMAASDRLSFDPTQASVAGLFYLGQLVIVVLGAMTLTAEYSTGMIRTSLTAMPRRTVMYAAKATVFAVVALVVTFVAAFVSFFLGQLLLGSTHDTATLSQPNVLRAVVGSALYVTLCGLFAFALGAILRHTAGAITAVIAPAVCRRMAPSANANRPQRVTYSALPTTARSTFGWDRVAVSCVLPSSSWPRKNDTNAATNVTTRATTAKTVALAAYITVRLGIAVSEVRIIPVEYSAVSVMAPRTTMTSWPR